MSVIKNKPGKTFVLYRKIRELLGHRALWLALILDEAERKGLGPEFAKPAIGKCGCLQGAELAEGDPSRSLKTLRKRLFSPAARGIFEMEILESRDDRLSIDFRHCPLVAEWQRRGYSDERIAALCDIAMEGDRGIASAFGAELRLGRLIAKGDEVCEIRFEKRAPAATSRR